MRFCSLVEEIFMNSYRKKSRNKETYLVKRKAMKYSKNLEERLTNDYGRRLIV